MMIIQQYIKKITKKILTHQTPVAILLVTVIAKQLNHGKQVESVRNLEQLHRRAQAQRR